MKNKFYIITLIAVVAASAGGLAFAKNEAGGQVQTVQSSTQNGDQPNAGAGPDSPTQMQQSSQNDDGNQVQNQNQTQNQGEDTQLQNKNQEQEQNENEKGGADRAKERRSEVANAVQKLLEVADSNQTIGEQIRVMAQKQNDDHEKIEQGLEKIQNRNQFVRFFLGVNYKEVRTAEALVAQNKARIQELEQLKSQTTDAQEQQKLTEQIKTLQSVNSEAEKALQDSQKTFSLFGWAFKFFSK